MAKFFPATMEGLIEVKSCTALGCLPGPGGLDEQTCGFAALTRYLASRGILEGLTRGSLG